MVQLGTIKTNQNVSPPPTTKNTTPSILLHPFSLHAIPKSVTLNSENSSPIAVEPTTIPVAGETPAPWYHPPTTGVYVFSEPALVVWSSPISARCLRSLTSLEKPKVNLDDRRQRAQKAENGDSKRRLWFFRRRQITDGGSTVSGGRERGERRQRAEKREL
ncbi:hypothetical protein Fot_25752 [Forsythia ovata]|uniref:Uncharacterized protein n=1 Tax=Forsythia ovata TaxID=205694 RepID=A0ABD1U9Y6_9LAMI